MLIETRPDFIARQGRSRDFLLVSEVGGFHPPNHKGAPAALAITIMVAASADFATPIGYQTNLMVYNAEGYRFSDFLRIGVPLTLLVGLVAVGLVPLVWGFRWVD